MNHDFQEILVYNYMGKANSGKIGSVFVRDGELSEKTFKWGGTPDSNFALEEDTGEITMQQGTPEGRYDLQFRVHDSKEPEVDVTARVSIAVKNISHEAVVNSGSFRMVNITPEEFISAWDHTREQQTKSKLHNFKEKFASILPEQIPVDNVDVFSILLHSELTRTTDVRFSILGSSNYPPVILNGILLRHREAFEQELGVNITLVGIDECLFNESCNGSCTNILATSPNPYTINANMSSIVGVQARIHPECVCGARFFDTPESCQSHMCYNGGRCLEGPWGAKCQCPNGYDGPRCQLTSRTYNGTGWSWYSPLEVCEDSHLSAEFKTNKPNGMILYNGPIVAPKSDENLLSDFISLEIVNSQPRLLINFGSGTQELYVPTKNGLDDNKWHRIDVFWNEEEVRMVVDFCLGATIMEYEDGNPTEFDGSNCQAISSISTSNKYLNVNTPLQIGGMAVENFDPLTYQWSHMPLRRSFNGCIRNVIHNSQLLDLAEPELFSFSRPGCTSVDNTCNPSTNDSSLAGISESSPCGGHGTCAISSAGAPTCECHPGWFAQGCLNRTVPSTFDKKSYVKYALSFTPDRFITDLKLRFRTRDENGELFRAADRHNREYGILEIKDSRLHFRYNLNSIQKEEKDIWLSAIRVDDGEWHTAKVLRYGSAAMLTIDGGEGRRYNDSIVFSGNQMMTVDRYDGVYLGGKAEYTGIRRFTVHSDYSNGCIDDVRFEGKILPLPPAVNGTRWGQATMARNAKRYCTFQ